MIIGNSEQERGKKVEKRITVVNVAVDEMIRTNFGVETFIQQ